MRWKLCFGVLLLLAVKTICRKATFRYLALNVTSNPAYVQKCTVVIKPDMESLDVDLYLLRDQDPKLRNFVSFSGSILRQNVTPNLQFDLPFCDIINNGMKAKSIVITNTMRNIFKQGTLPARCPIPAGNYTWRNLRNRKEHMPTYTLGGVYRLIFRLYIKRDMPNVHSRDTFVDKEGKVSVITAHISFTLK